MRVEIVQGPPVEAVRSVAARLQPDLMILGPVGGSPHPPLDQRSVRRLVRELPCSVLLLPHCGTTVRRLRQVVCAVEYDDRSQDMVRFARGVVGAYYGDRLHIVHEDDLFGRRDRGEAGSKAAGWRSTEEFQLEGFLSEIDFGTLDVRRECVSGENGTGVMEYARRVRADLVCAPLPAESPGAWDGLLREAARVAAAGQEPPILFHRPPRRGETPAPAPSE